MSAQPNLKTFADHWAFFESRDISLEAPHGQHTEMRRAFANGASATMALYMPIFESLDLSEEQKPKVAKAVSALLDDLKKNREWPLLNAVIVTTVSGAGH